MLLVMFGSHVLLLVLLLLVLPLAIGPSPLTPSRRVQQWSIIGTRLLLSKVALLRLLPLPGVLHRIRLHMLHVILQLMLPATVKRRLLLM